MRNKALLNTNYGSEKKKSKRTNLRFEFDPDESDYELPQILRPQQPKLKHKDFLKMYMQKNSTHDGDRENANSLVKNLTKPNTKEFSQNPMFNKLKTLEKTLNLHVQDLYALG